MLVFAGMFHLYRYGKNIPKSNIEVISSKKPVYSLSSFGNKMIGKYTSNNAISTAEGTGSGISSLPSNPDPSIKDEKPIESPEIKKSTKDTSSTSASNLAP